MSRRRQAGDVHTYIVLLYQLDPPFNPLPSLVKLIEMYNIDVDEDVLKTKYGFTDQMIDYIKTVKLIVRHRVQKT